MSSGHSAGRDWRLAGRAMAGALMLVLGIAAGAGAQEVRYLRVGTGPPGETRFSMGGLIASAVSNPPGSQPCARGGSCGVPGLIAVALATSGSVGDIAAIEAGHFDAALVQSDVAWWAAGGIAPFTGRPAASLRVVASLYSAQFHLVTRADSGVRSPAELRGKRVSLGENGSGTLVQARRVLAAWGVPERAVKAQYLRSAAAANAMQAGSLDAFFVVDNAPVPSVAELAKNLAIRLVPIAGGGADKLKRDDPLLAVTTIAAGAYDKLGEEVPTVQVGIELVVSAGLPDELVYALTRSLWHPNTVRMLAQTHPRGVTLALPGAGLTGLGIPLHPGAQRYYIEQGMYSAAR